MVDEGYYLMLAPLFVGEHTIHWSATMGLIPLWMPGEPVPDPPYPATAQDLTYNLPVLK
jgi:hypothetical protein